MNAQNEARTRIERVCEWLVWHFGELAGTLTPLVLAALVVPWLALLSLVAAGCWAAHEIRQSRKARELAAKRQPAQLATTATGAIETPRATTTDATRTRGASA